MPKSYSKFAKKHDPMPPLDIPTVLAGVPTVQERTVKDPLDHLLPHETSPKYPKPA